jgi:hypothetical protein
VPYVFRKEPIVGKCRCPCLHLPLPPCLVLVEDSVTQNFRVTAPDGKSYNTKHFSRAASFAVGYKVNSERAVQFIKWVTTIIESFIIKGFAMDDERLKNDGSMLGKRYFEEQLPSKLCLSTLGYGGQNTGRFQLSHQRLCSRIPGPKLPLQPRNRISDHSVVGQSAPLAQQLGRPVQ